MSDSNERRNAEAMKLINENESKNITDLENAGVATDTTLRIATLVSLKQLLADISISVERE